MTRQELAERLDRARNLTLLGVRPKEAAEKVGLKYYHLAQRLKGAYNDYVKSRNSEMYSEYKRRFWQEEPSDIVNDLAAAHDLQYESARNIIYEKLDEERGITSERAKNRKRGRAA